MPWISNQIGFYFRAVSGFSGIGKHYGSEMFPVGTYTLTEKTSKCPESKNGKKESDTHQGKDTKAIQVKPCAIES